MGLVLLLLPPDPGATQTHTNVSWSIRRCREDDKDNIDGYIILNERRGGGWMIAAAVAYLCMMKMKMIVLFAFGCVVEQASVEHLH